MEILSWHFWSHRASDRCLNFFSGQGALVVRIILLQIVNHSLRISQAAHTSSLWNPQKFGSFRSQGVITVWPGAKAINLVVVIWLAWTCSRYFVNSSCAVLQLCKAERESVKQQEHQAFSRHNVQLTGMKIMKHETSRRKTRIGPFPNCPTVLDETVKRRLVDVWATKICQVFVDLAEAQNAKGQFNRPNMTKLSREIQGGAISSKPPQKPQSAAKDPDPPWGSSPGSAWPARGVPPEVLELHRWSARRPGRWNSWFRRTACCGPRRSWRPPTEGPSRSALKRPREGRNTRDGRTSESEEDAFATTDRPYRNSGNHERWAWNMVLCSQIWCRIWVLLVAKTSKPTTLLRAVWEPRSQAS